jgi:hypothetical protein
MNATAAKKVLVAVTECGVVLFIQSITVTNVIRIETRR